LVGFFNESVLHCHRTYEGNRDQGFGNRQWRKEVLTKREEYSEADDSRKIAIHGTLSHAPFGETINPLQFFGVASFMRLANSGQQFEERAIDGEIRTLCFALQVGEQFQHSASPGCHNLGPAIGENGFIRFMNEGLNT